MSLENNPYEGAIEVEFELEGEIGVFTGELYVIRESWAFKPLI
ncbi:MAG: hypothetical protein P8H03_11805 [Emcibacteraceae bacterium]|nr:hypothetical protein [Emcibacteraceae bacterium]